MAQITVNPLHMPVLEAVERYGATGVDLARTIATVVAHDPDATLLDPTAIRRLLRTGLLDAISVDGVLDIQTTALGSAALSQANRQAAAARPALYAVA